MARKAQNPLHEDLHELGELLDDVSSLMDRTKVMYEQYFMGIQKMAPAQLHRDVERKLRELSQRQIRNTALRYRLATVTQKFGVYNTYWRRTMREIEQGRYVRDVARAHRRAVRQGADLPDEILASMPKRMRDRVLRDRALLSKHVDAADDGIVQPAGHGPSVHRIEPGLVDDDDLGVDLDALFRNLTSEAEGAVSALVSKPTPARAPAPRASEPDRAAALESAGKVTPSKPVPPPIPVSKSAPPPIPSSKTAGLSSASTVPPPIPTPVSSATSGSVARPKAPLVPKAAPSPAARPVSELRPVAPVAPAKAALPPGMTEAKSRDLYQRYLTARQRAGKSTNVGYDELMRNLNQQAPVLMKRHNAKAVEFDVQVKGDKVILKATPKR